MSQRVSKRVLTLMLASNDAIQCLTNYIYSRQAAVPVRIFNTRNHYPERASALDFENAATPRFGHKNVVFDLFIETCFFLFNRSLIQFLQNI